MFLAKTTLKTEGKSFHSHEIRFNYTRNTLQTRSKILNLLQNSIKIPYSDFKILFKSLKYIQSSLKSVLNYSRFDIVRAAKAAYTERCFSTLESYRSRTDLQQICS